MKRIMVDIVALHPNNVEEMNTSEAKRKFRTLSVMKDTNHHEEQMAIGCTHPPL